MGQAAVDLPDPLEAPVPPGAAGTDDLLSQLAGDEIDRLLAEAEVEQPPPAAPIDESPAEPPDFDAAEPAADAPPTPDADLLPDLPGATEVVTADDPRLTAQLDQAFDAQTGGTGDELSDSTPTAAAAEPAEATAAPINTPDDPGAAALAEATFDAPPAAAETADQSIDESPGLSPEPGTAPPEAASPESLAAVDPPSPVGRAPAAAPDHPDADAAWPEPPPAEAPPAAHTHWLLRPLEWISAPLNSRPESVRDAVGLIAIVSAVNAVAVLVYVLFFRRP